MTNEYKQLMQIQKYASNRKMNLVMIIIFILIGGANLLAVGVVSKIMSIFILSSIPHMIIQMHCSVFFSGLGATSPKRKQLTLFTTCKLHFVATELSYVLIGTLVIIITRWQGGTYSDCNVVLLVSAFLSLLMSVYMSLAYKWYIASLIVFLGSFYGLGMFIAIVYILFERFVIRIHIGVAFLLGFGIVLLGGLLYYIISKRVYKYPYDKKALQSPLQRD